MIVQGENFGMDGTWRYKLHHQPYHCGLHIHHHAELALVLEGQEDMTIDGNHYSLKKGEAAVILPLQPHSYRGYEGSVLFLCVFSEALVPEFSNITHGMTFQTSTFPWSNACLPLVLSLPPSDQASCYEVKALLYASLGEAVKSAVLVKKTGSSDTVAKVITYCLHHAGEAITLEQTGQALGYSRNYLSHIIQKTLGFNFRTLIGCIRVEKARKLLASTSLSITQIVTLCGFSTERSFHRMFLSLVGLSPSAYRKNAGTVR